MQALQSHLSVLEEAAQRYPDRHAFRIAEMSKSSTMINTWIPKSYREFHADVELAARYWTKKLSSSGLTPRSVVGLWLAGMDYSDVVNIYGMSRAGFVPQLFSLRLPSPEVVYELLNRAHAKALIYDPSFENIVVDPPVPSERVACLEELESCSEAPLPPFPTPKSSDLVFIFHTSGSTSGSPKLVPCDAKWVNSAVFKSKEASTPASRNPNKQDVSTWMGSMCHIGQTFMLIGSLQHGACTIQPSKIGFSSEELVEMINRCDLNRLHQFASFLSTHIRHARQNPKLLAHLQSLDTIAYSGLPLPQEDEDFGYQNKLKLINLFGSTECGAMMLSQRTSGPEARFLSPLKGLNYGFFSAGPAPKSDDGVVCANSQLLELVILSDSPDCPHVSLRKPDGHFHTGDLFLEARPGQYLFRGRDDDWIKSLNSLRCDTRAIEDNVRATCGDLVDECIVVGTGRSSPALFVEPATEMDHEKLKREIIRRTRGFHARRYLHERISDPELVIVVESKALPRTVTKGNIRRKAVEEAYKDLLDEIYDED
ncbi:acetyl-CoA synthetase-like protein [Fomitiporia mediterranea MF3/22]|uniref:acetyl-CoA synthetase-like protein n=1 Tax=Fomitiporia mediterranea (strain MF3/22) TaxID=694068 RepID=UPI0004409624|nr:acetyl-CoA synthetase-like protein [Fomitiporia mediterranea MF3/22]EJD03893.1 acetyl-CoA synthetase-like protein [Fomitiporia mediterranea MF3/22]